MGWAGELANHISMSRLIALDTKREIFQKDTTFHVEGVARSVSKIEKQMENYGDRALDSERHQHPLQRRP